MKIYSCSLHLKLRRLSTNSAISTRVLGVVTGCHYQESYILSDKWLRLSALYTKPHCHASLLIHYFGFKYDLGQKYYAPQIRPDRALSSWPPDYDSTFYVTETPVLTTPISDFSTFPQSIYAVMCPGVMGAMETNASLYSFYYYRG